MTKKNIGADRHVLSVLALALLTTSLLAASAWAQKAADDSKPSSAEVSTETTSDETSAKAEGTPEEEYEWFVEEGTGRQYRVGKIEKIEKTYKRVKENQVRFPGGATFDVLAEDDDWFHVKVVKRPAPGTNVMTPPPSGPSEAELAALRATYDIDLNEVDQLHFESFDEGLPRVGQWRNGFDLADMNGDGHKDIVFSAARKGAARPNIFLGDGAGNWRAWKDVKYARAPYDYGDVAVGDLDGDGHVDMAFGFHLRGLFVSRADGEGGFEAWTEGVELDMPGAGGDASSFSSRALELLDWNRDGKLDVVALGEGPKGLKTRPDKRGNKSLINTSRGFLVYLNNGDGSWTPAPQEKQGVRRANFGDDFDVADLDGDSLWDVVTTTRQLGSTEILAEVEKESGKLEYRSIDAVRPKGFVDSVEFADMNADGRLDIVLTYRSHELEEWRSGVDILLAGEDGTFERKAVLAIPEQTGFNSVGVGRLNDDKYPDLVVADAFGALKVLISNDKGEYSLELSEELDQKSQGCRGFDITLADLDGKKGDELVVAFAGEPTGYPGIPQASRPGCRNEGSVRAWKITLR